MTTKQNNQKKPVSSQTLIRGLDIIEAVASGVDDLSEIAKETGITYSTAHRIAASLIQRNYLRRESGEGYRLGRKLIELGFNAYSEIELTQVARPILQKLADETSDTVHLVAREQDSVIYLDKIYSRRAVEISSRIGGIKPLVSTGVGKALLIGRPRSEWERIYDEQKNLLKQPVSREKWLADMAHYNYQNYAYDKGEDEVVIRCVAAPIKDGRGNTVAAISVSSTVEYMDKERMKMLVPMVQSSAKKISSELGYTKV